MTDPEKSGVTSELTARALRGEPLGVPIVDAHAHLLHASRTNAHFPHASPRGMVESMDRFGIDQAVISVIGSGDGNDDMLAAIDEFPGRLVGSVLVNPRYPELLVDELERCFRHSGVRAIGEVHPTSYHHDYPVTGPSYRPVWEFAEERRIPVLIHAGPTSEAPRCRPSDLGVVAAAHPDMDVLVGHCGGYDSWAMLDEAIETTRKHDNVYLELSAMGRYYGVLEYLVDQVGAEKIVYGSDAPFHDWSAEIAHVCFAKIPERSKELIFGGTMHRLLERSRHAGEEAR